MAPSVAARLRAAGLTLPAPMGATANYVPHVAIRHGKDWLVQTAGQGPYGDGQLQHLGCVGQALGLEQARASAQLVALNVLGQANAAAIPVLGADALEYGRCLRLGIFVHGIAGYEALEGIANAASALMVTVLGNAGRHARSVAGMPALPMRISVEIDGLFLFRGSA